MKLEYFPMLRFFLFAALIILIAGCGSGGSNISGSSTSATSSTSSDGTGALTAKLVWNGNSGSSLGKVLALPVDVANVRITVSAGTGPAMSDVVGTFTAASGGGTLSGILAGSGRTVKAEGLDAGGTALYRGTVSVDIVAGKVNDAGTINMSLIDIIPPVTTASKTDGTPTIVTLAANEPATIYYTTNDTDPTIGSTSGIYDGVTGVSFSVTDTTMPVRFFAVDTAGNPESPHKSYNIITGSVTATIVFP